MTPDASKCCASEPANAEGSDRPEPMHQVSEVTASVAVGGNQGDAAATVTQALVALEYIQGMRVRACSNLYRSAPVGPVAQPDYINAAAVIETSLAPIDLLDALQAIETEFGRERPSERWGPRTLDLDIVTYAGREITEQRLTVPHPEAYHRCFVMVPLAEIAPGILIPGRGRVVDLAESCDTGKVCRITSESENG